MAEPPPGGEPDAVVLTFEVAPDSAGVRLDRFIQQRIPRLSRSRAQKIIRATVKRLPLERTCKCGHSLQHAIMTDLKHVPESTRRKLDLLLKKYVDGG